jgi:ElaB/YqjD/DUF883 family membrane-anchored ribosome-binding protein
MAIENPSTIPSSSTATPAGGLSPNGASTADAHKVVDRVAQSAHAAVDRLAGAAGPAIDRLRSSAGSAQETLQAKADQFGAKQEEWISDARNYVRENPLQALCIGLVAGYIIGRLGRSD